MVLFSHLELIPILALKPVRLVAWLSYDQAGAEPTGPGLERRTHISVIVQLGPPLSLKGREAYPFPPHSPSHTTLIPSLPPIRQLEYNLLRSTPRCP